MPPPRAAEIVLTDAERAELEGWTRRRKSAAGLALRSRIVLAAADGGQFGLARGLAYHGRRSKVAQQICSGPLRWVCSMSRGPGRPRVVGDDQSRR